MIIIFLPTLCYSQKFYNNTLTQDIEYTVDVSTTGFDGTNEYYLEELSESKQSVTSSVSLGQEVLEQKDKNKDWCISVKISGPAVTDNPNTLNTGDILNATGNLEVRLVNQPSGVLQSSYNASVILTTSWTYFISGDDKMKEKDGTEAIIEYFLVDTYSTIPQATVEWEVEYRMDKQNSSFCP